MGKVKDMTSLTTTNPTLPIQKIKRLAKIERIYKDIKAERDILKEELLTLTQKLDVYTLKTGVYTLFRAKRITPQVINFNVLEASLKAQNIPYETETVFTPQTYGAFRQAIKENLELDGLEAKETEYISVIVKEVK